LGCYHWCRSCIISSRYHPVCIFCHFIASLTYGLYLVVA
jgi:hypothetical protein